MRFKRKIVIKCSKDEQFFIMPAIGTIPMKRYYGYPVVSIGFAWMFWRMRVDFGVKRMVSNEA